ncbi:TPA: cyclic lactone autoinducer peptide, partial [Bacillus cytotoxicus]|nr:cyclic lactone autoinducer peptide [Bacillus cytotoxicus]HDR4589803.1 cyclic lactone autoinducer peptide [Bacillus cytotoxicus]
CIGIGYEPELPKEFL